MSDCGIALRDVDVYYPSRRFNTLSLKTHVFSLLRLQNPPRILHDVHALRSITLTIQPGERVGIIGRNGAGKSTLLRVIGGVFPARSGAIKVIGSVRSLFELSLGFEPDATGRENILYRGLLQGETPASIRAKADDIIAFADIGEFIDYPVKSYSAGMMVRLAFAISTCSSGDILLLDEVLGAGDAFFFAKARRRIRDLIERSRIMIFVSHDFGAIKELCNRVVHLEEGRVVNDGDAREVVAKYLEPMGHQTV